MTSVDLVYDADCPNVATARAHLLAAFARTGTPPRWREWDRGADDSPREYRGLASPTVLVEGRDVIEQPASDAACCRIYRDSEGRLVGAPPVAAIERALRAPPAVPGRRGALAAAVPTIGVALVPKLTCPLCWPAYSALLAAVGIDFVDYTSYLLPATVALVGGLLGLLARRAWRTRAVAPLLIGIVGATALIGGKFALDSAPLVYGGGALLAVAVLLRGRRGEAACPRCEMHLEPKEKSA